MKPSHALIAVAAAISPHYACCVSAQQNAHGQIPVASLSEPYLIDRRGDVRYWWLGELRADEGRGEKLMRRRIEELLAED